MLQSTSLAPNTSHEFAMPNIVFIKYRCLSVVCVKNFILFIVQFSIFVKWIMIFLYL